MVKVADVPAKTKEELVKTAQLLTLREVKRRIEGGGE